MEEGSNKTNEIVDDVCVDNVDFELGEISELV
jgi:hypothetical protein